MEIARRADVSVNRHFIVGVRDLKKIVKANVLGLKKWRFPLR